MPFVPVAVDLPPDLAEVRAGDVDGDGLDELILVSRTPADPDPERVSLTLARMTPAGGLALGEAIELGNRAALWDIHGGLWAVDGEGVVDLRSGERVAEVETPLAALGPTTPIAADVAHDLDGDGAAEILAFSWGSVRVRGVGGQDLGRVRLPGSGVLRARQQAGGLALSSAITTPPLAIADADGDGLLDLLMPDGQRLKIAFTGAVEGGLAVGARSATWALPVDLEPRNAPGAEVKKEPAGTWFQDMDGDGIADLLVQYWVTEGSFFGSTAELVFARGTGSGFAAPQRVRTETAAAELQVLDFDGDGDLDVVAAMVDIGISNLARALVARSVRIELGLFATDGGRLAETPVSLGSVSWPIEDEGFEASRDADVDGDGVIDLVTCDGDGALSLYRGDPAGGDGEPDAQAQIETPPGKIAVHDLDGDGRSELLIWGPEQTEGTLVRYE